MSQFSRQVEGVPFYSLFFRYSIDWMRPFTLERQATLLSLPIQMLVSSRNTLTNIPGIMFDQMSGYPVAQSS